jgi:hypothetical protein
MGVEVGGETFEAGPGSVVAKPRAVPHAFWNATDEPARILELIVPVGFERYFAELAQVFAQPGPPDFGALAGVVSRYELEIDPYSVGRLAEAHGLDLGACRS